jgi:hypothetical protein
VVDSARLAEWVAHVFEPEPHGTCFDLGCRELVELVTAMLERPNEVLAGLTDERINDGLSNLLGHSGFDGALTAAELPLELRSRCLRSMVLTFEQFLAPRCSGRLAHKDEPGGRPLDGVCYMWFDLFDWRFRGRAIRPPEALQETLFLEERKRPESWWRHPDEDAFKAEVFRTLRTILGIPHDSCREGALHGIGHLRIWSPKAAESIIDEFLAKTPELRPELVAYALKAREGEVP